MTGRRDPDDIPLELESPELWADDPADDLRDGLQPGPEQAPLFDEDDE